MSDDKIHSGSAILRRIRDNYAAIHLDELGRIMAENAKLKQQNEILLEAVKFYADRDHWFQVDRISLRDNEVAATGNCGGKRAREALAKLKDNKG